MFARYCHGQRSAAWDYDRRRSIAAWKLKIRRLDVIYVSSRARWCARVLELEHCSSGRRSAVGDRHQPPSRWLGENSIPGFSLGMDEHAAPTKQTSIAVSEVSYDRSMTSRYPRSSWRLAVRAYSSWAPPGLQRTTFSQRPWLRVFRWICRWIWLWAWPPLFCSIGMLRGGICFFGNRVCPISLAHPQRVSTLWRPPLSSHRPISCYRRRTPLHPRPRVDVRPPD